jgi:hypothetical protein
MQFCICIESPAESSFKASGRWTVEAHTGEGAVTKLLMANLLKLWPPGSVWHLSLLCEDCPYRETTHDYAWPDRAIRSCATRRAPLASGRFDL